MKTIIAAALLLPFAINAKEITPSTTLKVQSPDGLTSLKDLKAELTVSCKYKSGIFWPENKSCGYKTTQLEVSSEGVISLPAVETFSGPYLRNQLTKNYEISISVSEGKQYLANVTMYTEEAFKEYSTNTKTLNILKFKAARIAVSHDGQDFFGSDLSKEKDAYVLYSVSPAIEQQLPSNMLVSSSLRHYLWSAENKNLYTGKVALKDMKELSMPGTILAYLGDVEDLKLNVRLDYSINSGVHTTKAEASIQVKAKPTALEEIGSLELKNK